MLGGAGAGVTISSTYTPIRLTNSSTLPLFPERRFHAGEVTIAFQANTVFSVTTDTPGVADANGIGNLASAQRFTVVVLTASLAEPTTGSNADADTLNNRGFIDVTLTAPAGSTLDPRERHGPRSGVRRRDHVGRGHAGARRQPRAGPAQPGPATALTFRYWYTGTFTTGDLKLTFIAGSFNYLDASSTPTPNAAAAPVTLDRRREQHLDRRALHHRGRRGDRPATLADAAREARAIGHGAWAARTA